MSVLLGVHVNKKPCLEHLGLKSRTSLHDGVSRKTVLLGFTFFDGLDTTPPGTIEQPESEHG